MRSAALAGFAAVLVLFAAFGAAPFLTKERDFPSAVVQPPPLEFTDLLELRPGQTACLRDIAAEPHAGVARTRIGTYHKPGPAISLRITGPGYRTESRLAAGYADNLVHDFAIQPPPRAELVTACFRNDGGSRIAFYASSDRSRSRAKVTVDGRPMGQVPTFGFYEARPASIADRAEVTVERIATFRGPFSHPWVLWAVLAAFLIGVPLGAGLALLRVLR